jgi:peptidyl-prolyl cis-trans isomerase SurA
MSASHRRSLALALVIAAAIVIPSRRADAEVIERVVAVVNDDAVFLSELRRRAAPFLERAMQAPTQAQQMQAIEELYRQLLERIVQEELFIQAADRMEVSVTQAEVDRAIANVQRQSQLSDAQFWQAVQQQGFTQEQYRADVRRQLLRLKVLNTRARGRVNITEEQVRQRFDMEVARANRTAQFDAAQLFFPVPTGANASELAAVRAQAEEARRGAQGVDEFWAAGGVALGTLSQGDLPESLEDALLQMRPGDVSPVVRGPSGFHILLLVSRGQASQQIPPYDQVRMEIYQHMMEEAMTQQEELFLTELRRQAVVDVRL